MQETVWTLGSQISVDTETTQEVVETKVEPKKEELVADPSFDANKVEPEAPKEDPVDVVKEVEEPNDPDARTLADVVQEQKEHEEQQKRQAELDAKVNAELGIETEDKKDEVKTAKEIEAEVKEEIKEDPIVEVKQEEKKLSDEAVKTLEKIKEVYDKEVINLRVQNQILTQEKEAYKSKLDEVVKKNADLESTWASASTRAIYFDKVMESWDKWKVTDYLLDLIGVYYPGVSKEKLNELVASSKKSFSTSVKADTVVQTTSPRTNKLQQLQAAYRY